jgi:hypothetical protein
VIDEECLVDNHDDDADLKRKKMMENYFLSRELSLLIFKSKKCK